MIDQLDDVAGQWADWLRRWEDQQQVYIAERERCFDVMLEIVAALLPATFSALDIAAGPGSVSARLLRRFPQAHCLAVDADPVLLELGRRASGDAGGRLRWLQADLRDPAWASELPTGGVDLVVSSTATHWLTPPHLATLYRDLGRLLRPGGVLLNADQLEFDRGLTRIRELKGRLDAARQQAALAGGAEPWGQWWGELAAEPALRAAFDERARVFPPQSLPADHTTSTLDFHRAALAEAGFAEVAVLWQDLDHRLLLGLR